jgi:hypothetical protein
MRGKMKEKVGIQSGSPLGELKIEEGKGILKNPCDNTPVFYEKNNQGRCVPVKIRFYSLRRWFSILTNTFVTVFLPAILAAFVR